MAAHLKEVNGVVYGSSRLVDQLAIQVVPLGRIQLDRQGGQRPVSAIRNSRVTET